MRARERTDAQVSGTERITFPTELGRRGRGRARYLRNVRWPRSELMYNAPNHQKTTKNRVTRLT